MKLVFIFKRNALVSLALLLLLTALRMIASGFAVTWLLIGIVAFFGFLWANNTLIKRGRPVLATLLSLLLVLAIGFPAGAASLIIGRSLVEREYKTRGIQVVDGCNAAAANKADFDAFAIIHRLNEVTNSPHADTNEIARLQSAYVLAQEKAMMLNDDCRRRGHRDNHPWKTNWAILRQTSAVTE